MQRFVVRSGAGSELRMPCQNPTLTVLEAFVRTPARAAGRTECDRPEYLAPRDYRVAIAWPCASLGEYLYRSHDLIMPALFAARREEVDRFNNVSQRENS